MDKIKTYEALLNRTLDSLRVATYYDHVNRCEADKLYDDIKRVLSEPDAETDNGWISVKDKMPDECQEVLIYCPEFLEEIRKAFYTEGDFYIEKEDLIVKPAPNGYCTHWQYLPEPPKGE